MINFDHNTELSRTKVNEDEVHDNHNYETLTSLSMQANVRGECQCKMGM